MTAQFILVALMALLVYGLDRNHHRQTEPRKRLAGASDVEDRDFARVTEELRVAKADHVQQRPSARTAATVRLAIGPR